jgi:hypothetical protein
VNGAVAVEQGDMRAELPALAQGEAGTTHAIDDLRMERVQPVDPARRAQRDGATAAGKAIHRHVERRGADLVTDRDQGVAEPYRLRAEIVGDRHGRVEMFVADALRATCFIFGKVADLHVDRRDGPYGEEEAVSDGRATHEISPNRLNVPFMFSMRRPRVKRRRRLRAPAVADECRNGDGPPARNEEIVMAKGQKKSNKEVRKPKAEKAPKQNASNPTTKGNPVAMVDIKS